MEIDERVLRSQVFSGFERNEVERILSCTGSAVIRADRGNQLKPMRNGMLQVGILLSGSLSITRYDAFGNRFMLQNLEAGELFGLPTALSASKPEELSVLVCSASEILLMNADRFLSCCDSCCNSHRKLYFNLMKMLALQNLQMVRKQYHMAQRTLRRKLASFLSEQSGLAGSERFLVKMDRQELADYLGVDRSALCAELSRMKKEGLIDYYRHDFYIKSPLLEEEFI